MKVTLEFYEVEHEEDLHNVEYDITCSGGTVLESNINFDAETAEILIEIDGSIQDFRDKFKETESYGFIN